jgi:hypothetical protein
LTVNNSKNFILLLKTALPLFPRYETLLGVWKLKFDFKFFGFAFYSHATIDKQQDLGDNWQINFTRTFILTENNFAIISQTYENTVGR